MTTTREPDLAGPVWRAWKASFPTAEERARNQDDASVCAWLLHCPGAHAFWSYWWVMLIHLRDIPGQTRAPHRRSPEMGWEVLCFAQDPDRPPSPDDMASMCLLQPQDWVVQFGDVSNDAEAERIVVQAVRVIMTGEVSPDSDFRSYWASAFPATAKHYAQGAHRES